MGKKTILILILALALLSLLPAKEYSQYSLYVHGTLGLDALRSRVVVPEPKNNSGREGIALKLGADIFRDEDIGGKFGFTGGLSVGIPFHSFSQGSAEELGMLPSVALGGGILFRSRPFDFIDISLAFKGYVASLDYKSLSLGLSTTITSDIYFTDEVYMKVSVEYGSDIVKYLFGGDNFYDPSHSLSSFSLSCGAGYAFGGYSR